MALDNGHLFLALYRHYFNPHFGKKTSSMLKILLRCVLWYSEVSNLYEFVVFLCLNLNTECPMLLFWWIVEAISTDVASRIQWYPFFFILFTFIFFYFNVLFCFYSVISQHRYAVYWIDWCDKINTSWLAFIYVLWVLLHWQCTKMHQNTIAILQYCSYGILLICILVVHPVMFCRA